MKATTTRKRGGFSRFENSNVVQGDVRIAERESGMSIVYKSSNSNVVVVPQGDVHNADTMSTLPCPIMTFCGIYTQKIFHMPFDLATT